MFVTSLPWSEAMLTIYTNRKYLYSHLDFHFEISELNRGLHLINVKITYIHSHMKLIGSRSLLFGHSKFSNSDNVHTMEYKAVSMSQK